MKKKVVGRGLIAALIAIAIILGVQYGTAWHTYRTALDFPEAAQASVVVQRRNRLVRIQWEVPAAPPAGDYYPTPQAITEQEFENHVRQQEKKEQTQPSADGQQPPATAGETPDEASPAADGKTDKASAA